MATEPDDSLPNDLEASVKIAAGRSKGDRNSDDRSDVGWNGER